MTPKNPGGRPRIVDDPAEIETLVSITERNEIDRRAELAGHTRASYVRWVLRRHLAHPAPHDATCPCERAAA